MKDASETSSETSPTTSSQWDVYRVQLESQLRIAQADLAVAKAMLSQAESLWADAHDRIDRATVLIESVKTEQQASFADCEYDSEPDW